MRFYVNHVKNYHSPEYHFMDFSGYDLPTSLLVGISFCLDDLMRDSAFNRDYLDLDHV